MLSEVNRTKVIAKVIVWSILLGICFLFISYCIHRNYHEYNEFGENATGIVVAKKRALYGTKINTIRFKSLEGIEYESELRRPGYSNGQQVDIVYLKNRPSSIYEKNEYFYEDFLVYAFLLGIIFLFTGISLFFIFGFHHHKLNEERLSKRIDTIWKKIRSGKAPPSIFTTGSNDAIIFDLDNLSIESSSLKSKWKSIDTLGKSDNGCFIEGIYYECFFTLGLIIGRKRNRLASIDACFSKRAYWPFNAKQKQNFQPYQGLMRVGSRDIFLTPRCGIYEILFLLGKPMKFSVYDEMIWLCYDSKRKNCFLNVTLNAANKITCISAHWEPD